MWIDDGMEKIEKLTGTCRWHNPSRVAQWHDNAEAIGASEVAVFQVNLDLPCFMRQYQIPQCRIELVLNDMAAGQVWWDVVAIADNGVTYTVSNMPKRCGHYVFPESYKTVYVPESQTLEAMVSHLDQLCAYEIRVELPQDDFLQRFTTGCNEILAYRKSI